VSKHFSGLALVFLTTARFYICMSKARKVNLLMGDRSFQIKKGKKVFQKLSILGTVCFEGTQMKFL
jgi:hypothetical protein